MSPLVLFLSVFFSWFYAPAPVHDAEIAVFNLVQKEDHIELKISFDVEDFLSTHEIREENVTKQIVHDYITETTTWKINSQKIDLEMEELRKEKDHYHIDYKISNAFERVEQVEIENQFLLNLRSHSNIIMLDLNGKFRDFRMHKRRQSIKVEY